MAAPGQLGDATPAPAGPPSAADLEVLRRQRAGVHDAMFTVESAVAGAVPGRVAAWAHGVHDALVDLGAAFERHLAVTEGSEGLLRDIVSTAPHLAGLVEVIAADHRDIGGRLGHLTGLARRLDPVPEAAHDLREQAMDLLAALARHRQRGADLVYDAYSTDIGGSE